MQEWLENKENTHHIMKVRNGWKVYKNTKIYKKITAHDSKSYLLYLNKLLNQYNNTYHHSINKKPINADYSALTEKKLLKLTNFLNFKLMIDSESKSIRIFIVKVAMKIGQEKYLLSIVLWKLILRYIKSKI